MDRSVERTGVFGTLQLYEPPDTGTLPPTPMLTEFLPPIPEPVDLVGHGDALLSEHLTLENRMCKLEEITARVAAYCKMLSLELPKKIRSRIEKQTQAILETDVLPRVIDIEARVNTLEQRFDTLAGKFNRLLAKVKSRSTSPALPIANTSPHKESYFPAHGGELGHMVTPYETPTLKRKRPDSEKHISATPAAEVHELQQAGSVAESVAAAMSLLDVEEVDALPSPRKDKSEGESELIAPFLPPAHTRLESPAAGKMRRHSAPGVSKASGVPTLVNIARVEKRGTSGVAQSVSSRSNLNSQFDSEAATPPLMSSVSATRRPPVLETARAFELIPGMFEDETQSFHTSARRNWADSTALHNAHTSQEVLGFVKAAQSLVKAAAQ